MCEKQGKTALSGEFPKFPLYFGFETNAAFPPLAGSLLDMEKHTLNLLFGLKVRLLRQQQGLTFQQLAEKAGTTVSYLHDIEKGKKYPSGDKIFALAKALGTDYDYLVSLHGSKKLQPIVELLESDFFKTYPLDMFGLEPAKVIELLSDNPEKVTAFVSTILKIARNYHLTRENLYSVALRSFQDLHDNYFEDLETAAGALRRQIGLGDRPEQAVPTALLEQALQRRFDIRVDRLVMPGRPQLRPLRSIFSEPKKVLFLNGDLSPAQENFLLARELGFQYLNIRERPYETIIQQAENFEKLLNNFRASYFASAVLMDEHALRDDIAHCASAPEWRSGDWLSLLSKYKVTAEMFLQRLTNLLPRHFNLKDLFFIRLEGNPAVSNVQMTKELHLSGRQSPHATEQGAHYCRRWISVQALREAPGQSAGTATMATAQLSHYWQTENTYFCLTMAKPRRTDGRVSVTLGLKDNEALRRHFKFLDDPKLPRREVHVTCETCSIPDCAERAAPPTAIEQERAQEALRAEIEKVRK